MKRILIAVFLILTVTLAGCSKKPKEEQKQVQNQTQEQTESKENQTAEEERFKAPDFELKTLSGKKVKLSSLQGKAVVVNFYATWCPPCKAELPGFVSAAEKYKDKEIEFLFVDVGEKKDTIAKFLKKENLNMDPMLDEDSYVFGGLYGLRSFPTTFILDKEGYIVFGQAGFMDEETLNSEIQKVLK